MQTMKQVVLILVSSPQTSEHPSSLCSVWSDSECSTTLVPGAVLCLESIFQGEGGRRESGHCLRHLLVSVNGFASHWLASVIRLSGLFFLK